MKLVLAVALVLVVGVSAVVAQAPAPPVNLAFATLDTGSAWYVYGATMAELLRKTLPAGSNIDVKPRAGGVGNPRLVAKNETPLGLAFTVACSMMARALELSLIAAPPQAQVTTIPL